MATEQSTILGNGEWSVKAIFAGLAGGDLAMRVLPDLLGLGDNMLVPVGLLVTSQLVLDWSSIGWLFAWLLYASVVFQLSPLLFPRRLHSWAHSLPGRTTMTVSSVALGVFIEQFLLTWFGLGSSPLPVSIDVFPLVLLGSIVFAVIARHLPPVQWRSRLLYTFDETIYPAESAPGMLFTTQFLLVALIVGTILAQMSLLFPLPEVLILAVVGYDISGYVGGTVEELPARRDLTERVVQGASALWLGPRGLLWVMYSTFGLFGAFFMTIFYIELLNLWELVTVRPFEAAFVVYALVGMIVLVAIASTRLTERIPSQLQHQRNHPTRAQRASTSTPPSEDKPRLPGFMIPAGLLLLSLEWARPDYTQNLPTSEIPPFNLSLSIIALAVGAGILGVATIYWPEKFPASGLPDYLAAPISLTCFFTLGIGLGFTDIGAVLAGDTTELARTVSDMLTSFMVICAPLIGYELYPVEDTDHPGEALVSGLVSHIILAFVIAIIYAVLATILVGEPRETESALGLLLATLFVLVELPLLMGSGLRLLLFFFYGGEVIQYFWSES